MAKALEAVARANPRVYLKSHPKRDEAGERVVAVQASAFARDPEEARSLVRRALSELEKMLGEGPG